MYLISIYQYIYIVIFVLLFQDSTKKDQDDWTILTNSTEASGPRPGPTEGPQPPAPSTTSLYPPLGRLFTGLILGEVTQIFLKIKIILMSEKICGTKKFVHLF